MNGGVTFYPGENRLDYAALAIDVRRSVVSLENIFGEIEKTDLRTPFERARDILFETFELKPNHLLFDNARKTVYDTGAGESVSLESKRILLTLKGQAWSNRQTFRRLVRLLRQLNEQSLRYYLNRLDARRHFKDGPLNAAFVDLETQRGSAWITRASKGAVYIPEMLSKNEEQSNGSYFRSNVFTIAVYDKLKHILYLEEKLESLKDPKRISAIQQVISHFRERHPNDACVNRFEVRVSSKQKLQAISDHLSSLSEEDEDRFIRFFFESFYKAHRLKRGRQESEAFKQFFVFNEKEANMIDELTMEFRRIESAVHKGETRQDERSLMENIRSLHQRVLDAIDLSAEETSEESRRQMIRLIALADRISSFDSCMSSSDI